MHEAKEIHWLMVPKSPWATPLADIRPIPYFLLFSIDGVLLARP